MPAEGEPPPPLRRADDTQTLLLRLGWRLDDLDRWRTGVEQRIGRAERDLEQLVKAEEIAAAVAAKMQHDQTVRLTRTQRKVAVVSGVFVAAAAVAGFVLQALHALAH